MNKSSQLLIKKLKDKLNNALPGDNAHKLLEPETRKHFSNREPLEHARMSSVMILIYPSGDFYNTFTILRPTYDGVHSNQMAFPGGQREEQDSNLMDTAVRETKEEIGVYIEKKDILGKLTDIYIPPSNFIVSPYIAFFNEKPSTKRQPSEVEEIIEVNLKEIIHPDAITTRRLILEKYGEVHVPCFLVGDNVIWGATAMIMSELREVLRAVFE